MEAGLRAVAPGADDADHLTAANRIPRGDQRLDRLDRGPEGAPAMGDREHRSTRHGSRERDHTVGHGRYRGPRGGGEVHTPVTRSEGGVRLELRDHVPGPLQWPLPGGGRGSGRGGQRPEREGQNRGDE